MKICKAIKVCRKLAKSGLPGSVSGHRGAVRAVKQLVEKFDDELQVRSETTSLRHVAVAIAGMGRGRRTAAQQLECVADLATGYLSAREIAAKKDEISAVAIVRALAWNIRAARLPVPEAKPRRAGVARALNFA